MKGDYEGHELCKTTMCRHGDGFESGNFMPMDGTTCSNGAWCRVGKCVPDSRAPRAPGK